MTRRSLESSSIPPDISRSIRVLELIISMRLGFVARFIVILLAAIARSTEAISKWIGVTFWVIVEPPE